MVEVTNDIKNGDKVIANKDFKMYNNVFANKGDVFEVKNFSNNIMQLFNSNVTLTIDKNTFNEYFEKKNQAANKNDVVGKYNKKPMSENINENKPEVIYATAASLPNYVSADAIYEMLEEADYEINTVFDRCVIVSCKLPNGFVITESTAFMPKNFNEEIGVDICMDKIMEKLWELESYRLQNEIYEAEVLDECLNCERFEDCYECPFDIVYSRKNFGLDEE